ncbi:type II toxin-antitoxin system VapC family toxin [Candidatus Woesearchaeota archaeon]|nr:type II toxin-antitoxin system VapC family toxin [Candidatus Woesearchaeota archaeon]
MIGIDTTAIIDLFKGEPTIKKVLESIDEPLVSTQINYLEIYFGIDPTKHEEETKYYEDFFKEVRPLTLDNKASRKASELFWKLRKQGKNIGKFDCIIAAILISNGINKIITRNVKHFEGVQGIRVIKY